MASTRNLRGEMPFLNHLEELRWHILWSVLSVTVGAVIGFALVYYFGVLDLLIEPVHIVQETCRASPVHSNCSTSPLRIPSS